MSIVILNGDFGQFFHNLTFVNNHFRAILNCIKKVIDEC